MSVPVETLLAAGNERVVVETDDGTYTGRFVSNAMSAQSVMVLFHPDGGDPREPLVIDVTRIREIERAGS